VIRHAGGGIDTINPEASPVGPRRRSGRTFAKTFARTILLLLPPLLSVAVIAGCEDAYDLSIMYVPRATTSAGGVDWLVDSLPKLQPIRYDPPGVLPLESLDLTTNYFGPDQDLLKTERDKNRIIYSPLGLDQRTRDDIAYILRDFSGRPRAPKIDINDFRHEAVNQALQKELKFDKKTLAAGSQLYRKHCLHCHGLNGDGKGPTGLWVNPHPRDYRQGIFKFTSSGQALGERKPRREDLRRVLVQGIDGTSMPSFSLLPPEEIDELVSYVIHLSIRGEVEYAVMLELNKEKDQPAEEAASGDQSPEARRLALADRIRGWAALIGQRWLDGQKAEIVPTPDKIKDLKPGGDEQLASAARGYRAFIDKDKGGCAQCHLNFGRDAPYYYDAWGTIVRPRNLVLNNFRGGRRPIDVYWRIHSGINGTGMPALITSDADFKAKEDMVWDLVNFILVVPYPEMRQKLKDKYGIVID
jgi:mono/diheme cytochrome c family protein